MAQQTLNDTAGGPDDNLPTATAKLNSMFGELYALQSSTLNAADPRFAGPTNEISINNAINMPNIGAVATGADRLFIPARMLPFDASQVTSNAAVQQVREGGDFSVFDVRAYGASGDGITSDTYAFVAAFTGAAATTGATVVISPPPSGTYLLGPAGAAEAGAVLHLAGDVALIGQSGGARNPIIKLAAGTNRSLLTIHADAQGCRVQNILLDGNRTAQSGTSHGVWLQGNGGYTDGRHVFQNVFIQNFLSNGWEAEFQHSAYTANTVTIRNCGGHGLNLSGSDGYFIACTVNQSGGVGIRCLVGFNRFEQCATYQAGTYGWEIAAPFCSLVQCDSDSSQLDNYRIWTNTNGLILSACTSRDPGQATTATYSHIDVAAGLTALNIQGTAFKAKSLTNTAVYLIRCNGALTNSIIEAAAWETNAASLGILLFGTLTNVVIKRPLGFLTLVNAGATPDASGSGAFVTPTLITLTNTNPQTVTNLANGQDGDTRTIFAGDANLTIANGATMQLQGATNFAMTANDTLTLLRAAGAWRELSRSAN